MLCMRHGEPLSRSVFFQMGAQRTGVGTPDKGAANDHKTLPSCSDVTDRRALLPLLSVCECTPWSREPQATHEFATETTAASHAASLAGWHYPRRPLRRLSCGVKEVSAELSLSRNAESTAGSHSPGSETDKGLAVPAFFFESSLLNRQQNESNEKRHDGQEAVHGSSEVIRDCPTHVGKDGDHSTEHRKVQSCHLLPRKSSCATVLITGTPDLACPSSPHANPKRINEANQRKKKGDIRNGRGTRKHYQNYSSMMVQNRKASKFPSITVRVSLKKS